MDAVGHPVRDPLVVADPGHVVDPRFHVDRGEGRGDARDDLDPHGDRHDHAVDVGQELVDTEPQLDEEAREPGRRHGLAVILAVPFADAGPRPHRDPAVHPRHPVTVGAPRGGRADTLADQWRAHFGHREHLYGALLAEMADDWDAGGVTHELFEDWQDAPARQLPQLRLLAGLFRIVLRGDAPQLEGFYPCLGGDLDPAEAWAAVRPVLAAHVDELRESLRVAPQTNEAARTVALVVGLADAVRRTGLRRVRLLEPGASAGLGLLVDRYRFVGDGWSAGPQDSPFVVEGCGAPGLAPEAFEVVERRGCDVAPVDPTTAEGAAYLTSFVWPWQVERHQRLAAALTVAREVPAPVDRAPAARWVTEQLARPVDDDVLTVVWHCVTRLYWPAEETAAMAAAVAEARGRMPLAHLCLEHPLPPGDGLPEVLPVVEVDGVAVAQADHHGPPVRWIR